MAVLQHIDRNGARIISRRRAQPSAPSHENRRQISILTILTRATECIGYQFIIAGKEPSEAHALPSLYSFVYGLLHDPLVS